MMYRMISIVCFWGYCSKPRSQ